MQIIYFSQVCVTSSKAFATHNINPGTLAAGRTVKNHFKGTVRRFVASDNSFPRRSSVKKNTSMRETGLHDILALGNQLGIPTYFLVL